jgi:hypothetical protein
VDETTPTRTFEPRPGHSLRYGAIVGALAGVGMAVVLIIREDYFLLYFVPLLIPLAILLFSLRFLVGASARIEISPSGLTNRMRPGRSYTAAWDHVDSVKHETLGRQRSYTIRTRAGGRVYFTEEGLTSEEWQEIGDLIRSFSGC